MAELLGKKSRLLELFYRAVKGAALTSGTFEKSICEELSELYHTDTREKSDNFTVFIRNFRIHYIIPNFSVR